MLHYWTKYHPNHHEWRVKCCGCKAVGPIGSTSSEAVEHWTERVHLRPIRPQAPDVPLDIEGMMHG